MVPNIDKIRFVNSGTKPVYECRKISLRVTKKDKIIKFAGCYHGHSDFFDSGGSGAITLPPNSPGTAGTAKDTLLASYNDLDNVRTLIRG
jgi:glutamate-1-semialdehyde 2,1-aminomutase